MKAKIAVAANTAWYLANFRMNLFKELKDAEYDVVAIAPFGPEVELIEALGVKFISIKMDRMGTNPLKDFVLLIRYVDVLLRERPIVYLGYTIKPNIYGGIGCQILNIPSIHNIAGLGATFIHETLLTKAVCKLYRFGLRKAAKIFFQNQDDLELFKHRKIVSFHQTERLPGSGVDTDWFSPDNYPSSKFKNNIKNRSFIFLLSARLLWDKGIGEYVEAARSILQERKDVEFQLLGFFDKENPAAVTSSTVKQWEQEKIVCYLGRTDNVRPIIAKADCVVLPSYYREGVPRSLLEAASMGKPIITTNEIGCRETVEDGVTGYLCRARSGDDLAEKMRCIMNASKEKLKEMGFKGREKMIREFDEKIVINQYLETISTLVQRVEHGSKLRTFPSVP
jgi:glycosyltransferase involved in cell wall biosynthesis